MYVIYIFIICTENCQNFYILSIIECTVWHTIRIRLGDFLGESYNGKRRFYCTESSNLRPVRSRSDALKKSPHLILYFSYWPNTSSTVYTVYTCTFCVGQYTIYVYKCVSTYEVMVSICTLHTLSCIISLKCFLEKWPPIKHTVFVSEITTVIL